MVDAGDERRRDTETLTALGAVPDWQYGSTHGARRWCSSQGCGCCGEEVMAGDAAAKTSSEGQITQGPGVWSDGGLAELARLTPPIFAPTTLRDTAFDI